MNAVFLSMALVFGACVGSFLNVVILRLPKQQALTGRSHCPSCGHQLLWWELFPLVSFLALGGKCSSCKAKISYRYFIIELLTAVLFAACFLYLQPSQTAGTLFDFGPSDFPFHSYCRGAEFSPGFFLSQPGFFRFFRLFGRPFGRGFGGAAFFLNLVFFGR
jgi:prepilin signal peptidase PulO-like enzyme (type II secretory pathway)